MAGVQSNRPNGTAPYRIVIVGGGTGGWMTAAALAQVSEGSLDIRLVESDDIGTVGVGEATIPQIHLFNRLLGIDEAEFLAATQGTYKLGIEFDGWWKPQEKYRHNFGFIGRALGVLPFHQYWLRAAKEGKAKPLGTYVLNDVLSMANKFAHVERAANSPLPTIAYAYHFDAGLYARYLRQRSEGQGVTRIEGKIVSVERDGESGDVASVTLENGTAIAGDLFVDCSGFRGLLINDTLGVGWEDYSHWLPCDRAIAVPCASVEPVTPYTRSTAHAAGWQWRIPLQHRTGNGHVFSSAHMSEDEAASILMNNLDGEALAEPRTLRFTTGRRSKAWERNVVAIGLASGFVEPLESTSIYSIQSGIKKLIDLLPFGRPAEAEVENYNRQFAYEFDRIRDFIIAHYALNERTGMAFWDQCRAMELPDELAHKIALFRANGRIWREHDELFSEPGWTQLLIGQGVVPQGYHPLADQLSDEELTEFLGLIEQMYAREVERFPDHGDYVRRFASASMND